MNFAIICFVVLSTFGCRARSQYNLQDKTQKSSAGLPPAELDGFHDGGRTLHQMPEHELHWGYAAQNAGGKKSVIPEQDWGRQYSECSSGRRQSPIRLLDSQVLASGPAPELPLFAWPESAAQFEVINNRHTVQANFSTDNQLQFLTKFMQRTYALRQFHYHKRSEHLIGQNRFPLEVHFVHEDVDATGNFLVVGVFAQESKTQTSSFSKELAKLGRFEVRRDEDRYLPVKLGLSPSTMLPQPIKRSESGLTHQGGWYHYFGSLTTPPCAEKVNWVVLQNPVSISRSDIEQIHRARFDIQFENAREPAFEPSDAHKLKYYGAAGDN
jgi:carbonic anhydrase